MGDAWSMPDNLQREDGSKRRVGVEIELSGVPVRELAELTAHTLGGELEEVSVSEFNVDVPEQGRYRVEVDFKLLKDLAREQRESGADDGIERLAIEALSSASEVLVPCEVVAPPLAMEALPEPMDALVAAIRDAGGKGTRQSPLYAFGVHLNVEPPAVEPDVVAAYIRAFVCLFDWIAWRGSIDFSRRITPYIQRFPKKYEDRVLASGYAPDWDALIDDYLELNASRNRALDMLPLFGHVDEDKVTAAVADGLLKFRPAFHYRLANSCVDEPGWGIANPWRRWLAIERLANDANALEECCAAYREDRRRMLSPLDNRWREKVERWIEK